CFYVNLLFLCPSSAIFSPIGVVVYLCKQYLHDVAASYLCATADNAILIEISNISQFVFSVTIFNCATVYTVSNIREPHIYNVLHEVWCFIAVLFAFISLLIKLLLILITDITN
uniref:Uncharacterized protein n=1 Tax=Ciona savignyi TaxID=51511 RepID=H2YX82_CIOSA